MPEIKNTFTQGKMNKDLDERIIPNGQYRDAMNVQVSTSDGSDIGTVQNILGNTSVENIVGSGFKCVGSVSDEKKDRLYWFIKSSSIDAILEYSVENGVNAVLIDTKANTSEAVLKFPDNIITGINIIDDLLLWTDGVNEPRRINIERCKLGNQPLSSLSTAQHTKLIVNEEVVTKEIIVESNHTSVNTSITDIELISTASLDVDDELIKIRDYNFETPYRKITAITNNTITLSSGILGTSYINPGDKLVFKRAKDITEEHITSIKKNPLKSLNFVINEADPSDKSPLFEKIFPRFSYRYKYEDGEYSTFAPFTNVVFKSLYGKGPHNIIDYTDATAYGIQEPYNLGMQNMIQSIELKDFISPDMPKDVVQVDLLYKQENSPIVYILDIIKNSDAAWDDDGSNIDSEYKGSFTVKSENIYAALPENQLLRPWDNIPKTALAQEVTGNRVVYGNYTQGYNLGENDASGKISPGVVSSYDLRNTQEDFTIGGLPSVKSQRNYQIGVVYGDKYGRETPVFTGEDASLTIPWEDGNLNASRSLRLKTEINSQHPDWASYYKFFVKETSGEYYNLIMDAIYNPTVEDISEEAESHVWLSFASSDRNKVSEEDYIIFKKKIGENTQIPTENKYKILDIKNEAPESIQYKYLKLGEVDNTEGKLNDTAANGGIFHDSTKRPIAVGPKGTDYFYIHKTNWQADGNNGMSLTVNDEISDTQDLFISFVNKESGVNSRTERYKIASIRISSSNVYIIQLEKPITDPDALMMEKSGTTSQELHDDLVVLIERKLEKSKEAFSGRFFVKVNNKGPIENLHFSSQIETFTVSTHVKNLHWHADTNTASYDPANGLINNAYNGIVPSTAGDITSAVTSGGNLTDTEAGWDNLLTQMGSNRFFIDNMYMAASQPSDIFYAKNSGQGWYGGNPSVSKELLYKTGSGTSSVWKTGGSGIEESSGSNTVPTGWIIGGGGKFAFPTNANSSMSLQNPGTPYIGGNLINGIDGIVQTTDDHNSSTGIRRWRKSVYGTDLTDWDYGNHPSHNGKNIIHLSFLAPGEDLHGGDSTWDYDKTQWEFDDTNSTPPKIPGSLQGIRGGGVFTKSSGSFANIGSTNAYYNKGIAMEQSESSASTQHGGTTKIQGVDMWGYDSRYESRHDNQWKPWVKADGTTDTAIESFITALTRGGQKFKFTDDPDETIYTIQRVKEKRIYNHTPWRKMYKHDGSGAIVGTGDSVEEAAITWRDSATSVSVYDEDKAQDWMDRVVNFGKANNRRVCYIIHLEDPAPNQAFPTTPGNFDPTGGTLLNSVDVSTIEFIYEDFNLLDGSVSENPAIWETKPKENTGLDIYYETNQAYPIALTEEKQELFAPNGCKMSFPEDTRPLSGTWSGGSPRVLTNDITVNWNGEEIVFSEELVKYWDNDGTIEQLDYIGLKIRFTRDDDSYTTGVVTAFDNSGSGVTGVHIETTTEIGLSWYNCLTFGNGIESNRIRDDFNAMTLSNGVRANATLDKAYKEEHRKSGLIYSGLYNSTSGVNNLNQFIAAEKITKDLNPTYGSVQKLFSRRISLIAFCEDRVVGIIANKNALYNADGNPQVVATNAVLGDANPFVGDFGISKNPESFAKESYRAYFTDKQRGAVLRLSKDGLTPISDAGMHDYFRDNLKTAEKLIGTYDDYKKDYNLTLVIAGFLPENVVSNNEFEEGSGVNQAYPNNTEYITNGNFANGNNIMNPSPPTNVASNTDLNSITTITNWPGINVGGIVPQVQYQAPDPPTATPGAGAVFGRDIANPINVWTWGGNATPFTNANIGTPGASNVIKTESGETVSGAGNIYWLQGGSAHPYHQRLLWRQTNDWLEFDLDKLPSTNGIGDNVPTTDNANGDSVADLGGKDNTFYNGEEIRIKFKVKQSDTSNSWSNAPTMSVSLYDGPVDNSGNLVLGGTGLNSKLQKITTGNLPYENIKNDAVSSTFSVNLSGNASTGSSNITPPLSPTTEWTPGFTSLNPYTFPTLNVGDYEERWFWVYYKICDGTTNEGVVINDLRVKLEVAENDVKFATDEFIIERVYQLQVPEYEGVGIGSVTAEVLAVEPVPPSNVPAWAEVEHTAVNGWSASNSNLILNDFAVGEYGPDTGSGTLTGTAPNEYIVGTPNALTTYNKHADGTHPENGRLEISSGSADLTQDITSNPLVAGNWYEVILMGVTGTGNILVRNALDPSSTSGSTLPGHLGVVGTSVDEIIFDTQGHPTATDHDWKVRWQQYSSSNELKLLFNSFIGTIDRIEFADISGVATGGGANDWSLGGNDPIHHYYSPRKVLRYHNNAIRWGYDSNNDGTVDVGGDDGQPAYQNHSSWALPVTNDGYELRFQISLFNSGVDAGSLQGYVTGPFEAIDTGHTYGFKFDGITQGGYYKVTGNLDGTTNPTIERTLSDYVTLAGSTGTITADIKSETTAGPGHADKVLFRPTDGSFFKGQILSVSLKDITNYFTSASVGGWTFVGFDPGVENYITWDGTSENISFTNAPVGTSIQQALPNTNFVNGATVEFSFDADITYPGSISGYFYNGSGEGFTFGPITGGDGYNGTHVIGGNPVTGTTALLATQLEVLETSILRETLVIHVNTEPVNGTIDNFALYRIYPEITPSTVTYSEDTKGWVSFKSFIPESGLSLSKDYYTMKDGKLWQHHSNEIRNWFYGEKDENDNPITAESTITAMLNAEPSLIKIFNTLNYEGSQSKINLHDTQDVFDANGNTVTLSNAEIYNLKAKDGWYVENIITDKQSGSIQEFVEKEGKWFNYIKGTGMTETTLPSTADLSFQGLGMVSNTI